MRECMGERRRRKTKGGEGEGREGREGREEGGTDIEGSRATRELRNNSWLRWWYSQGGRGELAGSYEAVWEC
jgi:hypothetical protein